MGRIMYPNDNRHVFSDWKTGKYRIYGIYRINVSH
jgi:hypothetical protein